MTQRQNSEIHFDRKYIDHAGKPTVQNYGAVSDMIDSGKNYQKKNAKKELAEAAKQMMDETFREKFSLKSIASALYVNPSYLHRVFRAQVGQTMLSYHNSVRCEEAKKLLADPYITISYISSAVGFLSPSHFSKVFRKVTGMSPAEYRKSITQSADS